MAEDWGIFAVSHVPKNASSALKLLGLLPVSRGAGEYLQQYLQ